MQISVPGAGTHFYEGLPIRHSDLLCSFVIGYFAIRCSLTGVLPKSRFLGKLGMTEFEAVEFLRELSC